MSVTPFPAVLPKPELIASAETFFGVVKEHYGEYRARGMFAPYPSPGLWVYRLRERGTSYVGVLGVLPAARLGDGYLRRHEGTLAASEQAQLQLLVLRQAAVKPVLLTYPADVDLDAALMRVVERSRPEFALADGPDVSHELYFREPDSAEARQLAEAFRRRIDAAYVADGHHRVRALELYNARRETEGLAPVPLFAAWFSDAFVRVRPFHRVVQLPAGLSALALLARLAGLFEVEVLPATAPPPAVHHLTLLLDGEAFGLRWRAGVLPGHGIVLDAGLFNDLVAGPLFGIDDVRTDTRITYVPGIGGVEAVAAAMAGRPDRAGFLLHGIEARDMFAVVDAGMTMPPKSTWFEPRMRNGLVVAEV